MKCYCQEIKRYEGNWSYGIIGKVFSGSKCLETSCLNTMTKTQFFHVMETTKRRKKAILELQVGRRVFHEPWPIK